MEIIPAIDIRDGRCVRLYQGDFNLQTVFGNDPVDFARKWESLGAPRLHVVDLDGAAKGAPQNWPVIREIVAAVKAPVELGGGLRDIEAIVRALDTGVQRVVLGTAAIEDPALVKEACRRFGPAVVVGVDARNGMASVKGWTDNTQMRPEDLVARMADLGVQRIIYTDISRDGTLEGPNFQALAQLKKTTTLPIIASGGVASVQHLEKLAALGMEGVIIGKAFYAGTLDAGEVLARKW
ncbi:MAG: 1-(5-phosphoribosyl)-5-[(5-phosphoribosylamino)methylideneamino]imidazole-4-carboxamide isomerase [Chloroflexi bacterium]|nr:1-(5-phosphoribosyl)-5-[(5-phosphoribosylamino)methylideneamino]imidazole-4-carboxamide isomerase [Chloroflexota bacterium]